MITTTSPTTLCAADRRSASLQGTSMTLSARCTRPDKPMSMSGSLQQRRSSTKQSTPTLPPWRPSLDEPLQLGPVTRVGWLLAPERVNPSRLPPWRHELHRTRIAERLLREHE